MTARRDLPIPATGMIEERLELAGWRRQISELYAAIRACADPTAAWGLWKHERDRLYRSHPQSPIPAAARGDATAPEYYPYDLDLRTTAHIEAADGATFELPDSAAGHVVAERTGTARFVLQGEHLSLAVFWLLDYAGGFLVSFRDATCGTETYGAGRYVLDTAKGADLGTAGGRVVLDFNFAYQPSCSYDPRWSCPLPPRENWLTVAIRGGERYRG
ncbi:MAG TPA: DUF1684 domain-containing protein [Candidatus Saccharimonadales bacterium]|nr:DUF1684 domain-containing protein [Candidatus Saccharimonadales bacterium]